MQRRFTATAQAALERALDDPEDTGALAVLADELATDGDDYGELIALMLRLPRGPVEDEQVRVVLDPDRQLVSGEQYAWAVFQRDRFLARARAAAQQDPVLGRLEVLTGQLDGWARRWVPAPSVITFRRGVPVEVLVSSQALVRATVPLAGPVGTLHVRVGGRTDWAALVAHPWLEQARGLVLKVTSDGLGPFWPRPEDGEPPVREPWLKDVFGVPLAGVGADRVGPPLRRPKLPKRLALAFEGGAAVYPWLAWLLRHRVLEGVTQLELPAAELEPQSIDALTALPLESLVVTRPSMAQLVRPVPRAIRGFFAKQDFRRLKLADVELRDAAAFDDFVARHPTWYAVRKRVDPFLALDGS